jgi:hypothetical protein
MLVAAGSLGLAGSLLLAACGSAGPTAETGSSTAPAASSSSSSSSAAASSSSSSAAAAISGGGSAGNAGGQVQLKLPFNATCFNDDNAQTADGTGFDSGGTSLPSAAVKAGDFTGTVDGVTVHFLIPKVGANSKSCLQFPAGKGGTFNLQVPSGKYKEVFLLEGAGNGPGTVDLTLQYGDGTSSKSTLTIDDWCVVAINKTPAPGATLLVKADHRVKKDGSSDGPDGCGLLGIGVKPDASKTLTAISLANPQPQDPNNTSFQPNVVAVTLQPA